MSIYKICFNEEVEHIIPELSPMLFLKDQIHKVFMVSLILLYTDRAANANNFAEN